MPVFTRRDPGFIPEQQRSKDRCVVVVMELMICSGDVGCIQTFSRFVVGSAAKYEYFSRVIVENGLSGQRDWREASSPAKWVKTAANNLADKEYWVQESRVFSHALAADWGPQPY